MSRLLPSVACELQGITAAGRNSCRLRAAAKYHYSQLVNINGMCGYTQVKGLSMSSQQPVRCVADRCSGVRIVGAYLPAPANVITD